MLSRTGTSGRGSAKAFSKFRLWLARALAAAVVMLAPLGATHALDVVSGEASGLLGAIEIRSPNLEQFPKWLDVLARYASEERDGPERCKGSLSEDCAVEQWKRFLAGLEGLDALEQIEQVNRYFNRLPYVPDESNYGTRDYWETPFELLARGGDCEDYAVAKFLALRALGFERGRLRLMVVQDLVLGAPHALLTVRLGDEVLVLDSLLPEVTPAGQVRYYKPIYSVDEDSWWLHLA